MSYKVSVVRDFREQTSLVKATYVEGGEEQGMPEFTQFSGSKSHERAVAFAKFHYGVSDKVEVKTITAQRGVSIMVSYRPFSPREELSLFISGQDHRVFLSDEQADELVEALKAACNRSSVDVQET